MSPADANFLSPLIREIIAAGRYDRLVVTGGTSSEAKRLLGSVTPNQLLVGPVINPAAAHAILAALWLWHDSLHECHEIVQQSPAALNLHSKGWNSGQKVGSVQAVENDKRRDQQRLEDMASTLAFWHAIMHRREGDFGNSKYWYARCRNHPAIAQIADRAAAILQRAENAATARAFFRSGWSPEGLVDLAEETHRQPADSAERKLAVELQRLEWAVVFDETIREATA